MHRDLKPENLLLEGDGPTSLIKVIDFGTSQRYDPTKKMEQRFGTPYYIAPEVLKGNYDNKCDMWSCGVIMFILLSGRPPFDGSNDTQILEAVKKGKVELKGSMWSKVSEDAKDIVKKLLAKDPSKRLTANDAL